MKKASVYRIDKAGISERVDFVVEDTLPGARSPVLKRNDDNEAHSRQ